MEPSVSVIVPVFNREKLIIRSLDSIASQREKPEELIIVDNGSSDSSREVIKTWINRNNDCGFIIRFLFEEDKGACRARQKGLTEATGEFVLFFDSDDEMKDGLIKHAKAEAQKHKEADIICWPVEILQLNGKMRNPPFNPRCPIENHMIHGLLRTQGYMVRRDFLLKAGGWNKNPEVWNDWELGLRLLLHNPVIKNLSEIYVRVNSQPESITGLRFSDKEGSWEATLSEMRKELNNNSRFDNIDRINKMLQYREVILAAHYYKEGNKKGADALLSKTLEKVRGTQKLVYKFSYHYTRLGGRGAWRMVRYILFFTASYGFFSSCI